MVPNCATHHISLEGIRKSDIFMIFSEGIEREQEHEMSEWAL